MSEVGFTATEECKHPDGNTIAVSWVFREDGLWESNAPADWPAPIWAPLNATHEPIRDGDRGVWVWGPKVWGGQILALKAPVPAQRLRGRTMETVGVPHHALMSKIDWFVLSNGLIGNNAAKDNEIAAWAPEGSSHVPKYDDEARGWVWLPRDKE